jgi:hypothetical protein
LRKAFENTEEELKPHCADISVMEMSDLRDSSIFFSVNVPHYNADSLLIEAITLSQTEEKPPKRSFLDFLKPKKNT